MIQNRNSPNEEEWGHKSVADFLTQGRWTMYRNFLLLFIKTATVTVMVWLRYRIGRKNVSLGSLVWALWLMGALFLIFGVADQIRSVSIMIPFIMAMTALGVVHLIEGGLNLQRISGPPRYSYDPGRSIIWLILGPILRAIRMAPKKGEKVRFFQLNEGKWIRFGEPLLVFLIGDYLQSLGYIHFGAYIQIAGICMFIHLQVMVNNYFEMVQTMWDGKELGGGVQQDQAPVSSQEKAGKITMGKMPKSSQDFEQWKQGKG